ncbi:MAG: hypothetical protein ACKOGK_05190, partial [Betaproteobacteria bacterium]
MKRLYVDFLASQHFPTARRPLRFACEHQQGFESCSWQERFPELIGNLHQQPGHADVAQALANRYPDKARPEGEPQPA